MVINRTFNFILQDNEENYLAHLENIISVVDELSHLEISKLGDSMKFRIATSLPRYNNILLEELLKFHNRLGLKLELSKSIKTSGFIEYSIKN